MREDILNISYFHLMTTQKISIFFSGKPVSLQILGLYYTERIMNLTKVA